MKKVLLTIGTLALLLTGCGVEESSADASGEVSYNNNITTESTAEIIEVNTAEDIEVSTADPRFEVIPGDAYTESLMTEFDYACYVYGIYVSASEEEYIAIKPIEWIDSDDEARIKELGLTEEDLISGYYIIDDSEEIIQLKITDETKYQFIDWGNDYTEMGSDRTISTTDESFFIDYLRDYGDMANKYPLFIWLNEDSSVERIMEKPLA